jgi:hypothetical protein
MLQLLPEQQAACLETAAWYRERAAANTALSRYLLQMASCWEGLARSYAFSQQLSDFVAAHCVTPPSLSSSTNPPAAPESKNQSLQGRAISPVSLECAQRAVQAEGAASRAYDPFLQQGFHRLADAWRRLGAAYKLSEDVDRDDPH